MTCNLQINNLLFSYDTKPVIEGLSLRIREPGIIALLGLNGEGKSTLLKLIAGILPANPHSIQCTSTGTQQSNPIGYLSERPQFYPELTVTENIDFAARIQGIENSKIENHVSTALQQCQLENRRFQLAGNLSKGYQQRLGLAMAMVHQPQLLLLDEPTDGLDPQQIRETHNLISSLSSQCAVIISSHRLDEISQLCNRLLILHRGNLAHDSNITDPQQRNTLAQLFLQITGRDAA